MQKSFILSIRLDPALVAMRFNPDLRLKYQTLRDAGKPAKVAIVAIMRKLIETANALVKTGRPLRAANPNKDPRRNASPQIRAQIYRDGCVVF